jgi:pimeloyl-ACP methyl ester carboxylesterase
LWADTCPRLRGWDALRQIDDPIVAAYAWVFRGCRGATATGQAQVREGRRGRPATPVLMMTGRQDAVVPPRFQALWEVQPGMSVSRLSGADHVWDSTRATTTVRAWISRHER